MGLRNSRVFIESAARDFRRTGAIAPSSRPLADSMTRELVSCYRNPVAVLEVGGGTGSVTKEIARHLAEGDALDVFEIDPQFANIIRQRLREEPGLRDRKARIRVHNKPVEEIAIRPKYDFIISCLPFTNFQPQAVRKIFEIYRSVLKADGVCSFYEYIFVRQAAQIMSSKLARERCAGVSSVVREYLSKYCFKQQVVFRNLPPAMVYHIRFC
jgi:phosphatidylethanolamine/phosphatidyl-N-methylethanolamine N-methyltransferase